MCFVASAVAKPTVLRTGPSRIPDAHHGAAQTAAQHQQMARAQSKEVERAKSIGLPTSSGPSFQNTNGNLFSHAVWSVHSYSSALGFFGRCWSCSGNCTSSPPAWKQRRTMFRLHLALYSAMLDPPPPPTHTTTLPHWSQILQGCIS